MDCDTINLLAEMDPRLPQPPAGRPKSLDTIAHARFVARYVNLAFGWYIATSFADHRLQLPATLRGKDEWLLKAHMMRYHFDQYRCEAIIDAYGIATSPAARQKRAMLCGMLLAGLGEDPASHRVAVAERMHLKVETVEAFDALFYNVIDRHKESAFLALHVYPNSRFVEFSEDYMKTAATSDLIKRVGYNSRDVDHTSYLIGMGDPSYMAKLSARPDREQELTRHLMGNALLLVQSGVVNQRNVGISRAQTLVAASRQAGPTVETPPVADAGQYMSDPLRIALLEHDAQRTAIAKADAGG